MPKSDISGEVVRCPACGEAFASPHDCNAAREARALFEAARRANSRDGADRLSRLALALATKAETSAA